MIALHDIRNPVWAIYFLSIVGVAHFVTTKQMLIYVQWVTINYLAVAVITDAHVRQRLLAVRSRRRHRYGSSWA